jgi:hypothetical protein
LKIRAKVKKSKKCLLGQYPEVAAGRIANLKSGFRFKAGMFRRLINRYGVINLPDNPGYLISPKGERWAFVGPYISNPYRGQRRGIVLYQHETHIARRVDYSVLIKAFALGWKWLTFAEFQRIKSQLFRV